MAAPRLLLINNPPDSRLEASYLNADEFLAVSAFNSRLDDLVVRDKHVHMRDRKQCEADTEEVEEVLNEYTESRIRKVLHLDSKKRKDQQTRMPE